jgi:tetratricopeptide (TPR) repeat protein
LLGRLGLRFHRLEFALKNFQKSAEHEPNNIHTAIEIAWCHHQLKDYAAAIDGYERAIQQRPDYASAHACLGLSLAEVHRHQEAIDELRRAIRIRPKIKDRLLWDYNLGTLLAYTERWKEAIEPLSHSIELKPCEASTHYWLGRSYAEVQRHAEAVEQYKEALKLKPNEPDSLYAMGQFDKAADCYSEVIQIRPEYADAHFNLGVAYGELGRRDEEIREYKKATDIVPDDFIVSLIGHCLLTVRAT